MDRRVTDTIPTKGFTLLELSIIIVIIGILVSGVSIGLNLIKQAEIRAVIQEKEYYTIAVKSFKMFYGKMPGDMKNAYSYWGANCAASAALCNGNNDNIINHHPSDATMNEQLKAWKHLSLSGMIDAYIAPITTVAYGLGINIPASKRRGMGYTIGGISTPVYWPFLLHTSGNRALLTVQEMFYIDQKTDDGMIDSSGNHIGANTGKLISNTLDSSGVCANNTTGIYNLMNNDNEVCTPFMSLAD